MARIGFVGLGNMGLPMALNLVKAGHDVTGFDLSPQGMERLVAGGGKRVDDASALAANCETVITMLPAGKDVRAVYLGTEGLIAKAQRGTLFIDSSTIDVESARAVAAEAEARGMLMLDAPVSASAERRRRRSPLWSADPKPPSGKPSPY